MNIFISYCHEDKDKAFSIERDLKLQHIGIWIDKKSIRPGDIWLKEIDEGLSQRQVDYVIGIITKRYIESTGMIEAYVKISEGLRTKAIKFIPLFFEDIGNINSVILSAITGIKFIDYDKGLFELLKFLNSEDLEDSCELLSKIQGEHSPNPFRRVRAEFFENDYDLGMAFASPENEKYELVCGRIPLFIFGGRGSGKTMILKSLTPEVLMARLHFKSFKEAKQKGIDFFGIYLRLLRGSFSMTDNNTILTLGSLNLNVPISYDSYKLLWEKIKNNNFDDEPIITSGITAAQTIFVHELNFKILKTLLMKLKQLQIEHAIEIDSDCEQQIATLISKRLKLLLKTFTDLKYFIDGELDKINNYLQRITLPSVNNAVLNWIPTSHDFLDYVCKILVDTVPDLKNTKIYFLLDEFENLFSYQQKIINEWVKTANNFVVKIGSKFEGMYTNLTLQGQQLQFKVGECDDITLDYDLFNDTDISKYQNLLKSICHKLLKLEAYSHEDIENILEVPTSPELPQNLIDDYLKNIIGKEYESKKITEYRNKYEVASIFRLLRKKEKIEGRKSRKKIYAGFDTYTYLSSGIIRIFLNLVGMAFYRAEGNGVDIKNGGKISIDDQSWAARIVSKGYLEKIHKNVEAYGTINGEMMYQFVIDVGDIFREKLLCHLSEPETLSLSIQDPQNMDKQEYRILKEFFTHAVRESIFYKREETSSYLPKQSTKLRTKDYVLNRIYTPTLQISHRARWGRCTFKTNELSSLLHSDTREEVKKSLQQRQRGKEVTHPLFDGEHV